MDFQGLENVRNKKKKTDFDYDIEAINAYMYKMTYTFNLKNNTLKRILKLSLRATGQSFKKDKLKELEDQKIPFSKAYMPYLNKFMKQPFYTVKEILEKEDSFSIKTYEVKEAYFIYSDNAKDWQVEILTEGNYIDLLK